LIVTSLLISGCSSINPEPTPVLDNEPQIEFAQIVSATGVVLPEKQVGLSMVQGGRVAELLVEEGDEIAAGALIARLEQLQNRETLEAGAAGAAFEVLAATQALDDLYEAAPLLGAQAQLNLAAANDLLDDTEYRWRVQQPGNRASGDAVNAAEANLVLADQAVERAQKEYNKYSGRAEDDPVRALALSNLSAARQQRDAVLRQLNWYTGQPTDLDQALLDAEVALAQAQADEAARQWGILQAGPDPDQVALAEERIANAQAQLAAAEAALENFDPDLSLYAPFSGTVAELYIETGEWVSPGIPVLLLANIGQLRVETTDLNEIDVAQIEIGDQAAVTFDALVDVEVTGVVVRIADKAAAGSGVNYKVVIELAEIPPNLRWGMTAFVDIQLDS
jgi:multidrug resistance efflux pump